MSPSPVATSSIGMSPCASIAAFRASFRSVYQSMRRSVSSFERNAPCNRAGSLFPGGMKSMSPLPSSDSAPMPSRIVRLSICDATRNAIRLGKLALMRPVMTFTDGRWVARMRWMPIARAFWASIASGVSTSAAQVIIRSASSSMTTTMYGRIPPV